MFALHCHGTYACNAGSRNRFVDFTYGQMYLSTTSVGFIAGQGDILQHEQQYNKTGLLLQKQFEELAIIKKVSKEISMFLFNRVDNDNPVYLDL